MVFDALHRERVQTPYWASWNWFLFLTAGLRRLWPCCLPLPGFPQAAYLWTLMGAGVHSNSLRFTMPWTTVGRFVLVCCRKRILEPKPQSLPQFFPMGLLRRAAFALRKDWLDPRLGHINLPGTHLSRDKPRGGSVSEDATFPLCNHTVNAGEGRWQ